MRMGMTVRVAPAALRPQLWMGRVLRMQRPHSMASADGNRQSMTQSTAAGVVRHVSAVTRGGALSARRQPALAKSGSIGHGGCGMGALRVSRAYLHAMGRIVEPKPSDTPYRVGQYFMHEQLGYRGIISAVWPADIIEYDCSGLKSIVLPRQEVVSLSDVEIPDDTHNSRHDSGGDMQQAGTDTTDKDKPGQKDKAKAKAAEAGRAEEDASTAAEEASSGNGDDLGKEKTPASTARLDNVSPISKHEMLNQRITLSGGDGEGDSGSGEDGSVDASSSGRGDLFGVVEECWGVTDVNLRVLPALAPDIIRYSTPYRRKKQYWYQAMVDKRDFADDTRTNIACRNLTLSTPTLEYVDYVCHDDIMPYAPEDPTFDNNFAGLLFSSKLMETEEGVAVTKPFVARWLVNATKELEDKTVYQLSHDGFTIKAIPFYAAKGRHSHNWFYKILIEAQTDVPLSLIQRTWITQDGHGEMEAITGRGVVGFEPVFDDECGFFSYSSKTYLDTSRGCMGGFFTFLQQDSSGHVIHVPVPTFDLLAPANQPASMFQAIKR